VYVTPHDVGHARAIVEDVRAAQDVAGRGGDILHVFGDLVVFLGQTETEAAEHKARLDELAGERYASDAVIFTGTPAQLADTLLEWRSAGLTGFRLRPGALPRDLRQLTRGLVPELQRHLSFRTSYTGTTLRERLGLIFDQDIIGRPDTLPVLAAIAAVTSHLGVVGTLNATFNEPYELARQLASLDHLSGGRAGWNVVTSFDGFTGRNFRRGGFLDRDDRYARAGEFIDVARQLWDSWPGDAVVADSSSGQFLADPAVGTFSHHGKQFDISGQFNVPRSPQGRPVILQAGVSPQGRDFAAANADAIFSPYHQLDEAQAFYRDIRARVAAHGRPAGSVKLLPSASFVLGDTEARARERHREISYAQVSGRTAQILFESVWNRDLSGYDPDGPLPDLDPDPEGPPVIRGRAVLHQDAFDTVARWRALASPCRRPRSATQWPDTRGEVVALCDHFSNLDYRF